MRGRTYTDTLERHLQKIKLKLPLSCPGACHAMPRHAMTTTFYNAMMKQKLNSTCQAFKLNLKVSYFDEDEKTHSELACQKTEP